LDLGQDLGVTEEDQLLVIDLDDATAIRGQENLVTFLELRGNDLSLGRDQTLSNGDDVSLVQGFLSLLGDVKTRGRFLFCQQRGGLQHLVLFLV